MKRVIVIIEGGVVQRVQSNSEDVEILIVDHDNMTEGNEDWARYNFEKPEDILDDEALYMNYLDNLNEYGHVDGFQIETEDHEIPEGLFSFQIFDNLPDAVRVLEFLDDPKWKIIPIFPDDIENFEVIMFDELVPSLLFT